MVKIVALLTDYGTRDQYAGSLRGAFLGSAGRIEIAVNLASAAKRFEARIGCPVTLKRLSRDN